MIRFDCPNCSKSFQVADEFAGRNARCNACRHAIVVPQPQHVEVPAPQAAVLSPPQNRDEIRSPSNEPSSTTQASQLKLSLRERRLHADAEQMASYFVHSPHIRVEPKVGNPAELYLIEYRMRGLMRGPRGEPVACDRHLAQIQLTRDYPRQAPKCKMLTPVFHPNIEASTICVGDHWTAGERLVDLVIRIGEMIAYQAYNVKSPLDGEAARWADLNKHRLPIDDRDLHA